MFDLLSGRPIDVFLVSFLGFFMSIAIDSDEDAWRTLSQLVNGELDTASVDELEFGDWVKSRV